MTHADAGMLDQVLMNLAVNARDAMPKGGQLVIKTAETFVDETLAQMNPDAAPGRYACLTVADTGCGIPADVLQRIFEPFFSTKEPGKGTGLGLATVFGIIKQHRGWLKVDSEPGRGTTFQVYVPAIVAAASPDTKTGGAQSSGGTETILLVEDDVSVRRVLCTVLTRRGYKVLEAANGLEALEFWEKRKTEVALLLTDLVMPAGMSGHQLARRLQAEKPDLKVVYVSGYSAEIAGYEIQLRSGENFMQKPLQSDQILETVRRCLDAS
jgi:CheY-like chemotaxis protein